MSVVLTKSKFRWLRKDVSLVSFEGMSSPEHASNEQQDLSMISPLAPDKAEPSVDTRHPKPGQENITHISQLHPGF